MMDNAELPFKIILLGLLFGFLVSIVVHGIIELPILYLFQKDFAHYSLGFPFETWVIIHHIGSVVLILIFLPLGVTYAKKIDQHSAKK